MPITREQVLHVAKLARLDLRDDEVDRLTRELGAILEAVSKVSELDLADVPPTSHPLDLVNVWAEDEPHASLSVDEALANAPAREGDLFRVPPTAVMTRLESAHVRRADGTPRCVLPAYGSGRGAACPLGEVWTADVVRTAAAGAATVPARRGRGPR